jgi:monofunctional biosynthetic peptidoglycan transglycosylase
VLSRPTAVKLVALALLALGAFALFEWATWPDVAILARENPGSTAFLDAWRASEKRAGRNAKAEWRPVPWSRISDELKLAVVVAEDIDFFQHEGFATAEMKKAIAEAWEEKELPRGASTITQQLAKNLWLSPSRNPLRKLKEALLTRQLEARLSKRRILELYLNVAELGPGVWGAEAAARRYFGESAAALSAEEAAALAAALPRPSTWHPGATSSVYRRAVARVLGRMREAGWVRREIAHAAP